MAKVDSHAWRAALLAVLAGLLTCLLCVSAPTAFADPVDSSATTASEDYQSGTIPILRLTFHDDVDPETGDVVLSGDEKIDLMNQAPNHSYRATGVTFDLEVPATYDNPEDDLWDGVSGYAGESNLDVEYIRGRGNSTWRVDKKPYKIKLDKKANLFGMGANKHWALLANYYDPSLTLDRMVGWIGEQMGFDFTPRGVPVDLYMNGTYCGNYLLMEEVRIDDNRVEIDEVDEDASDPDSLDITGDYLLGTNRKPNALEYEYFHTSRNTCFSWDTPEYEAELTDAQAAQQAYMKAHLDRVEDALYSKGLTSSDGESVWDLIDMQTFADMWWVQEFTTNPDAYGTPSTYLYKLRDTVDGSGNTVTGKLYWGPLWDFDFVWGGIQEEGFDNTEATWVSLARQDPEFVAMLKERWEVMDGILEEITREDGLLDQYEIEMRESWEGDAKLWPREDDRWAADSYAVTLDEIRSAFEARRAWINANLDKLQTEYYFMYFMVEDEQIYDAAARMNTPAQFYPEKLPDPEDQIFVGWFDADGEEYSPDEFYNMDKTFYAKYMDASEVPAATDIFLGPQELWITYRGNVSYELMPDDAVDNRIVWTSSDESVVTVNENGLVTAVDGCLDDAETARATITARLVGSGKEASVTVVVYNPEFVNLPEPETITVESDVTMEVGDYHQISYEAEPTPNSLNKYEGLFYGIEDSEIADVSPLGVIMAKASGTTTITVYYPDPETYDFNEVGTIKLVVTEPEPSGDETETGVITYDLNGGSIDGSSEPIVEEHKVGDVITIMKAPEREGYTFTYWKGSEYHPGDEYTITGDHTLTAQWEKNSDDGSGTDDGQASGGKAATPKTGDNALLFVALSAAAISGAIALAGLRKRRRN